MDTLYYIILVPMVYVAFAVFITGIVIQTVRVLRRPKPTTPLHIHPGKRPVWLWTLFDTFLLPTVFRHNRRLWVFLMMFHICFFLVIIGHLELISEMEWIQVIEHDIFLGQGFLGLFMAVALLFFLFRRFVSPTKDLSVPEDYLLLILLFLTVIFGSEMDWARRWYYYEEMSVDAYRAYLSSLVFLKPEIVDVSFSGHAFMLVLHVFFANLFLMFFPFSPLMHSIFAVFANKLRRG
ncbi:MAG: respiratory nitrate reductase subunit gamma [Deltaproteobacteria bacterium]|nr:respiratory nitrate reductase subunit gamma [Deltaproteobacteria bacterium]MBW2132452.1 respiratory nitrate reductase subunit gamma [Deltaproteobacteria bacterium]